MNASSIPLPAVPDDLIKALEGLRAPVIITHVVPDADALGSMIAMSRAWTNDDRRFKIALPAGSLPQRLAFLCEWAAPAVASEEDFAAADGFVVVDTARFSRCNVGSERKKTDWRKDRLLLNVDHHETNERFGSIDWIVADASSTAELVYRLLRAAGRPIDGHTASVLYAGIQTDTLGFSLPTTNASSLQAAAELAACGARVGELGERLYRSQRKSEFELLRVVYANTRLAAGGRIAYASAGYDEIHRAGCTAADIDDQINVPRSLEGVELAMLFSEGNRGKTRINFRGSGRVTVVELAAEFGGGGHSQAAGAVLHCPLEDAIAKVVPRAVEYIERF